VSQVAENLQRFLDTRNGGLASDALLKGGMGLAFSCATFGGFWWIAWLILGSWKKGLFDPLPLGVTLVYVAVASWSAWRGVDPLANLTPLTQGNVQRHELEAAVSEFAGTGGLEGLGRREGVAGCANVLLAGPQGVVGGWNAWRKRVEPEPELVAEAAELLASLPAEAGGDRGALLLLVLGLAQVERDERGELRLSTTRKGRGLLPR